MSARVVRTLMADRGDAGERIDKVLQRRLADLDTATRSRIQRWLADGHVTVNGRPRTKAASRVMQGDAVEVSLPAPRIRLKPQPEALPLTCLYDDPLFVAIDKPAGLVAHPTFRHPGGTLMNGLLWLARGWPAGERPSLLGRLDRQTSGLVLVARTRAAHATLQKVLGSSWASKEYLAVVYGKVSPARGRIDLRLGRSATDRRRVEASETRGVVALTTWQRLAWTALGDGALSVVHCRLGTGRMHQIRVHLAAKGWPIVGDAEYGRPLWQSIEVPDTREALASFPRQALHAWRVSFPHPVSGARVTIQAPLPADITALLTAVGMPPMRDDDSGA